jgi:hypothetical protein
MKDQIQRLPPRERYRAFVSLVIIPLGIIIAIRAAIAGIQAWTLILLGLAFVGLGLVRLRSYWQYALASRRK